MEANIASVLICVRNDDDDEFKAAVLVSRWSWHTGLQEPLSCAWGLLAEKLFAIHSQTLTADMSPLLGNIRIDPLTLNNMEEQTRTLQESVDTSLSRIHGFLAKHTRLDLAKVPSKAKPSISTNVTFDSNATLAFFQSAVYTPIPPDENGQMRWAVSLLLDIFWLETPMRRKTGRLNTMIIIGKEKECLAIDYHPQTHTVIYSLSVRYYNKAKNQHWISSSILVCHLSAQLHDEYVKEGRPHILYSEDLEPGDICEALATDRSIGRLTRLNQIVGWWRVFSFHHAVDTCLVILLTGRLQFSSWISMYEIKLGVEEILLDKCSTHSSHEA